MKADEACKELRSIGTFPANSLFGFHRFPVVICCLPGDDCPGADHDARDEPGRRLIYVQMVDLMTTLGDKVPLASSVASRNICCLDQFMSIIAFFSKVCELIVPVQLGLSLDEGAVLQGSMLDDLAVQVHLYCKISSLEPETHSRLCAFTHAFVVRLFLHRSFLEMAEEKTGLKSCRHVCGASLRVLSFLSSECAEIVLFDPQS